jgi:hypothetical protein
MMLKRKNKHASDALYKLKDPLPYWAGKTSEVITPFLIK